ncbi:unnamed protein product [Amoebophrya sp. A120]|nr:unnamed protein product [Amoebophrya sp. A120]|eukprot:GSA120T00016476001.1
MAQPNLKQELTVDQVFEAAVPVEVKKTAAEEAEKEAYALERKRSGLPPLKVDAPTAGPEYSACFYKRSNSKYGSKAPEVLQGGRHGLSNRFSQNLGAAGMWRNHGLNTYLRILDTVLTNLWAVRNIQ